MRPDYLSLSAGHFGAAVGAGGFATDVFTCTDPKTGKPCSAPTPAEIAARNIACGPGMVATEDGCVPAGIISPEGMRDPNAPPSSSISALQIAGILGALGALWYVFAPAKGG